MSKTTLQYYATSIEIFSCKQTLTQRALFGRHARKKLTSNRRQRASGDVSKRGVRKNILLPSAAVCRQHGEFFTGRRLYPMGGIILRFPLSSVVIRIIKRSLEHRGRTTEAVLFCRLLGVALGRPPGKTLCRFATLIDTDITVVTGLLGGKRGGEGRRAVRLDATGWWRSGRPTPSIPEELRS